MNYFVIAIVTIVVIIIATAVVLIILDLEQMNSYCIDFGSFVIVYQNYS